MQKMSSQHLEEFQIHCHLTVKILAKHNKSETAQDIDLKFSAFVHQMSGLNRHENSIHCSTSGSVAPSSMQNL